MISFVVAVSENGVIGKHNSIPWYIKEDLQHFKDITIGHTVLMGRKTYESIIQRLGKPLPNRKNVIISRQENFQTFQGVCIFRSVDEALKACANDGEIMVCGGGQIYQYLIDSNQIDRIYLTRVHKQIEGDVLFPKLNWENWREINRVDFNEYSFIDYERIT